MRRTKDISRTRRANLFSDMFNVARKLVAQITTDGTFGVQLIKVKSWIGVLGPGALSYSQAAG
jgi:hypothetical protein